MPNKRKLPGGTTGWTGSTMRENQQEDVFLPCDDRLVAVNVGPDYHYGSLVYDTNQNNEYDADRSAWLQSAFRVLKQPLGGPNAIGFQLYFTGNGETKGGWFVDVGDGSSTKANVATGGAAAAGSGMVATGTVGSSNSQFPLNNAPVTFTTTNAGASGGIIIGQGSYNDGGPFHVGNKNDKHQNGFDADGNPINSLHIDTDANFYKNQVEDGPLRFEDTYQTGKDAPIVVPVHLGWTGKDWAWWSTSYLYNPDPTPTPKPYPYGYPLYPYGEPTPTPTPTPTPIPNNPNPWVPTGGNPIPWVPTGGTPSGPSVNIPTEGSNGGYVPISSGGPVPGWTPNFGGGGDGGGGGVPTGGDVTGGGVTGGGTTGTGGAGGTPQPGDIIGYTDSGIPIRQPPNPPGYNPQPPTPQNPPPNGGGQPPAPQPPTGPQTPHIPPDIPIYQVPPVPVIQDLIGSTSTTGGIMNTIASTGAIVSQAMQFAATNYGGTSPTPLFNDPSTSSTGTAAADKSSNSDPACGGMSSFAAQGGTTPSSPAPSPSPTPPSPSPGPSPTPSPAPASTTGGQGDPWNYTQAPRDTVDGTKPRSKYKRGSASGGICFHPSETDLRDIPVGLVPPNTTMSTTTITVGPNAFFAAGVPELSNGGIKNGYQWGVDATTGDLVFYSISFSQAPIEAVRFCNTGQVIRWRSTENVYGELSHANTGNQRYSFPDQTGTVMVNTAVVADNGGGTIVTNGHTGGSGPVNPGIANWGKYRALDGHDYLIPLYQ